MPHVNDLTRYNGWLTGADISTVAADRLAYNNVRHVQKVQSNFILASTGTPVARIEVVFVASGAGNVLGFSGRLVDTGTNTAVSFDLKKNGTSVLSGTVDFTHSDTDGTVKDASIATRGFVAGDVFTFVVTQSANTGAQGPFAMALFDELVG